MIFSFVVPIAPSKVSLPQLQRKGVGRDLWLLHLAMGAGAVRTYSYDQAPLDTMPGMSLPGAGLGEQQAPQGWATHATTRSCSCLLPGPGAPCASWRPKLTRPSGLPVWGPALPMAPAGLCGHSELANVFIMDSTAMYTLPDYTSC